MIRKTSQGKPLEQDRMFTYNSQLIKYKDNIANLQNEVNKFVFVSETEFANITREDGKVYGVYNEETGIITWYYGNIGVI